MKYTSIPPILSSRDILASDACLSPSRYLRFTPPAKLSKVKFAPYPKIVAERLEPVKKLSHRTYQYIEIGDIDANTGFVVPQSLSGYEISGGMKTAHPGDLVISTVRTYRGGVGQIIGSDKVVVTAAIQVILGAHPSYSTVTKEYLLALLRSQLFREQVWAALDKGVYPRLSPESLANVLLPIPRDAHHIRNITALVQAYMRKRAAIRTRSGRILEAISRHLAANQKRRRFAYQLPTRDDIMRSGRFDSSLFDKTFKKVSWLLENYKHGYTVPSASGFTVIPGPSLEERLLGASLRSDTALPGFRPLILPSNLSSDGTVDKVIYLKTNAAIPSLRPFDILFGEAGFQKGRSAVLIDCAPDAMTNAHGIAVRRSDGDLTESIVFRCVLHWLRENGLIDAMAVGGSGGHFSPEYFDMCLLPKFPPAFKRKLRQMYYSGAHARPRGVTWSNLVRWHENCDKTLGVWDLAMQSDRLQKAIEKYIESIVDDAPTQPPIP